LSRPTPRSTRYSTGYDAGYDAALEDVRAFVADDGTIPAPVRALLFRQFDSMRPVKKPAPKERE
jgi:hypothetical protein